MFLGLRVKELRVKRSQTIVTLMKVNFLNTGTSLCIFLLHFKDTSGK